MKSVYNHKFGVQMEEVGTFCDDLIGAKYELIIIKASSVAKYLKSRLKALRIDYNDYNSENSENSRRSFREEGGLNAKNPPKEIYEYQNFFLLKDEQGEYVLLDGFRRLLWYNAPDVDIYVRIYDKSLLAPEEILKLAVYLNHFKFFSHSDYYDRGFALLLKTVFDLDILKYHVAFDSYLSSIEIKNSYVGDRSEGSAKNNKIKARILNKKFLEDIRFLQALNELGYMVNSFFGALVYSYRDKYPNALFLLYRFVELATKNQALPPLMDKYAKCGTNRSAESQKVVNQILEIYENILKNLCGVVSEKSYAEKMQECKELSKQLAKDKNWTKLTGAQSIHAAMENFPEG